jgi:hypothetical protein
MRLRSGNRKHSGGYNFLQVCAGVALAAFLVLGDRAATGLTPQGETSGTVLRKDALAAGIHVVRLEYDHVVLLVNRLAKAL